MNRCTSMISGLLIGVLLAVSTPSSHAQEATTAACLRESYDRLAAEQRLYRSVILGQKTAADLPVNSVRYDKEGDAWMKTEENAWRSLDAADRSALRTNMQMDDRADPPVRRGILESKQSRTSDIIPPLLQSFRAFRCRLAAVCASVTNADAVPEGGQTIDVQTDGCREFTLPVPAACKRGWDEGIDIAEIGVGTCREAADALLAQEEQILILLTAYDAAYRSSVQFTGIFQDFLDTFSLPILGTLWQTVRTFGRFDGLPCFLAQCDE